ncbi:MAG: long-chain fatty acid--CoA ligase [Treponema sp.]|nr:long-chain fatty acid--CoA ligase [Treponema sp.]
MESLQDLGQYTFKALLTNSVNKFADRPALALVGKKEITYKELNDKSIETSKLLLSFGLKAKSKVAIFATGRPEWGIAYFAIVNSGMIAVPLLPDFSDSEVLAIITHCEIDAIFVDSKLYEKLKKIEDKLPDIIIKLEDFSIIKGTKQKEITEKDLAAINVSEEDIASIIYTSGTTGRSKGVVLTHKNLVWNAIGGQWFHRINKMDRCLSFLPLSHVYEFTIGF